MIVVVYLFLSELPAGFVFSFDESVGFIFGLPLLLALGTIVGTVFCAFYIGLVGAPIAALLGDRIAEPYSIAFSLVAALTTSYVATSLLVGNFVNWTLDMWPLVGLAIAYSVPAGLLYRRFVISERNMSRWS